MSTLNSPSFWRHSFLIIGLVLILAVVANAQEGLKWCTYQTFKWNVKLRSAVEHKTVRHPYDELMPDEMDPLSGCTVCEEDQETIHLPPLAPFHICKAFAPLVRETLSKLIREGQPIFEVIGYHVGRTRGEPDTSGNRTGFSNHSYGIAIDINPQINGLYDNCIEFGPNCRLIRGGPWRRGQPGALTSECEIVKAMKAAGFRWGGEIPGKQKDFMHFSPTGY